MDNRRLVLENAAMTERWSFYHPKLCRNASGALWWELEIRGELGNRLPIRIEYPADYPASPPSIAVCATLPADTPHFPGNRMCWHHHGEARRSRNKWCPGEDTAALCVGVAQRWFYAFLVWLTTREWPVRDAAYG